MKTLQIEQRTDLTIHTPINEIIEITKDCKFYAIDCINWSEFPYKPSVKFLLVQIKDGFYLKFEVKDDYIKCLVNQDNGPVYKDSCVEFFIQFKSGGYYNLEINCRGLVLFGYGNSRGNRELAPNSILKKIIRTSSLQGNENEMDTKGNWEVSMIVPFIAFFKNGDEFYDEKPYRGNFYKCGDNTKIPHYLSWNPIKTSRPDFHRPEYFGEISIKDKK